jgi:hypothetical protein
LPTEVRNLLTFLFSKLPLQVLDYR